MATSIRSSTPKTPESGSDRTPASIHHSKVKESGEQQGYPFSPSKPEETYPPEQWGNAGMAQLSVIKPLNWLPMIYPK